MAWGHKDFYKNTAEVLDLKNTDKLLEIGFGSGIFIKKYASQACKIAGIDYSEDMLKLACSINKKLINERKLDLRYGNASSLPWQENEFSAVVAIETFFFWPEPDKALKEILRVLMPGGRFILEMSYNHEDGLDHTEDIIKMKLRLYTSDEIAKLLIKNGFSDIDIHYYKGFWLPFKGYMVTKGMVIKATKGEG
jgi:ubiquinone/menaquinone biosynthesis C-methylase UbiE